MIPVGDELLAKADELQRQADEMYEHLKGGVHGRNAWTAWDRLASAARYARDAAIYTLRDEEEKKSSEANQ